MLFTVFIILYGLIIICGAYHWVLVIASFKDLPGPGETTDMLRFAVAIPAHNEAEVIRLTIETLLNLDYPSTHFDVFVAADNCTDNTAQFARSAGAVCFEKDDGGPVGKGLALNWLIDHIFQSGVRYDAVVVFDADTQVDPHFLNIMNARLNQGAQIIQGKHIISNPDDSWYTSLAWALMTIDNRYCNQGRQNLGLSVRLMGDSICIRSDILRSHKWGVGLTEDYDFRLRLLLEGLLIEYEPSAVGYGQSPRTWKEARSQRLRWLKGYTDTGRRYRRQLFSVGMENKNITQIDGVLGTLLPSYSTLTLLSTITFILSLFSTYPGYQFIRISGVITLGIWIMYPFIGLVLEQAPLKAYLVVLSGPFYILWRSWLRIRSIFLGDRITWVRTPRS